MEYLTFMGGQFLRTGLKIAHNARGKAGPSSGRLLFVQRRKPGLGASPRDSHGLVRRAGGGSPEVAAQWLAPP